MWQKLWQHFLVDQDVLQQMQNSLAEIKSTYGLKHCLEIGPGQWALTKRLKSVFPTEQIFAFEADLTLEKKIAKFFPLEQVVWGDVLEQVVKPQYDVVSINWSDTWFVVDQTLIAGNLPYYITSPILRKFFEQWMFTIGRFLIQKEVADKIDTYAKKKSFLRWIMNYQYTVKTVIAVQPEAFAPPPRVDSAVITIVKHDAHRAFSIEEMLITLDMMSQYSRKTLGKISKMLAKRDIHLRIPEPLQKLRVEELWWEEMENIIQVNR